MIHTLLNPVGCHGIALIIYFVVIISVAMFLISFIAKHFITILGFGALFVIAYWLAKTHGGF